MKSAGEALAHRLPDWSRSQRIRGEGSGPDVLAESDKSGDRVT